MAWLVLFGLALLVLAGLFWLGRMPRKAWELAAAAVLLGIAGYAWQGRPAEPGSPRAPVETAADFNEALADSRDDMGSNFGDARAWIVLADAQSRQGKFASAATVLRRALLTHPDDPDIWLALGNALVGHNGGLLSPAAQFAYQKAARIAPNHPGPPFFMGLALATSGQLQDARRLWAELLARAPENADWREDLEQRLARLDSLIVQQGGAIPAPPPSQDSAPSDKSDATG